MVIDVMPQTPRSTVHQHTSWWVWAVPFTLFCVLASSRWLLENADPQVVSTPLSQAGGCAMAALLFAGRSLLGSRRSPNRPASLRSPFVPALFCVILLLAPSLGNLVAGRALHADTMTLALALVPVVVAVCSRPGAADEAADVTGRLWPGLAGLAGLLLLLPQPSFHTVRPWLGLAATPVLVGLCAARLQAPADVALRPPVTLAPFTLACGSGLAACCFLALPFVQTATLHAPPPTRPSFLACALEGCLILLLLLSLERMAAMAWSAQYLVVPLLSLLQGVLFLHPVLDVHSWIALALLALGAARLLAYVRTQSPSSTLRLF